MTELTRFHMTLDDLQMFVDANLKPDTAEPEPDVLFDAAMEGHFELSGRKTKSGNPEVWEDRP